MDARRAALAGLKTGQLRQEARAAGVDMSKVEAAIDEEDKPAIIELILAAAEAADEAAVRAELAQMKTGALRKRAMAVGADMGKVDAAIDDEDKAAIVELIAEAMASSGGGLPEGVPSRAAVPEPEPEPETEPEPEPEPQPEPEPELQPEPEPGKLQLQVLPEGKRWHFFVCHHQVRFRNLWPRVLSSCSAEVGARCCAS